MDLNNLTPEQQTALATLFGNSQPQPKPGSMNPEEAIKYIGLHLSRNQQGQLQAPVQREGIIPRLLFGKTKNVTLPKQTDYFQSAKAAGIDQFLPQGLPVTPEGTPFVTNEALDNARQLKEKTSDNKNITDPGRIQFMRAFIQEKGTPQQLAGFDQMAKDGILTEKLFSSLPSYATERNSFYTVLGADPKTGKSVQYNSASGKASFVDNGEPFKGDLGRLINKNFQTVPEAESQVAQTINGLVFDLNNVKQSFLPENIGPLAGRWSEVKRYLPDTPEALTNFKASLQNIKRKLATEDGGKQLTPFEYQTLVKSLPDDVKSVDDFVNAMDRFERQLGVITKRRSELSKKLYGMDVYTMYGTPEQSLPANMNEVKPLTQTGKTLKEQTKPKAIKTAADYMSKFNQGKNP